MDDVQAADSRRVASIYQYLLRNEVTTCAGASLLAFYLIKSTELPSIKFWWAGITLVSALRLLIIPIKSRLLRGECSPAVALAIYNFGALAAGIAWSTAFFIVPDQLTTALTYVAILVACVMAISCNSYQTSFSTVLAFNLPIIATVLLKYTNSEHAAILALGIILYGGLLILNAYHMARRFHSESLLQLKNENLINSLAEQKARTESLNRNLEKKFLARTESLRVLNEKLRTEISQRQEIQEELATSTAKFSALYHDHPSILLTVDDKGYITNVNQYGASYLGYPHSAILRMRFSELCTRGGDAMNLLDELSSTATEARGRLELVKSTGEVIAVQATLRRVVGEAHNGSALIVCEDVTEIDRLQQQLAYHASRDTLTGLYNRREFEIQINQLFEQTKRHPESHVLCIIDLDRFKTINDTSGHLAGDEMLKSITEAMKNCMRQTDILARLGGDEFGIIMEKTAIKDAQIIIERLRDAIQRIEVTWEGVQHHISASFGLTELNEDTLSVTNLMRDADAACYLAKESGRNCVRTFDIAEPSTRSTNPKLSDWSATLRSAVSEQRLFLAVQEVINQRTRCISQREALIRIQETDGFFTDANLFISAAERLKLTSILDKWMFDNAVSQLAGASDNGNKVLISLNLAATSLADPTLCTYVLQALEKRPAVASNLCFEVKETTLLGCDADMREFLANARGLGVKLTVDDFGASFAGFNQLEEIPVDYVKLTPLLTEILTKNEISHEILNSIIKHAGALELTLIAKGVTTPAQISSLLEAGVEEMQGYAISEPRNLVTDSLASLRNSA
ncbi:MAG: putative bifunctional diguanylate cyclase/phosphodiesterase [Gammaproteobacteria bacterium]